MAKGKKRGPKEPMTARRKAKAMKLAKKGCTDKEIFEAIGISSSKWYDYNKKNKDFSEAIKEARETPIEEVEAALFKKAVGYEFEEVEMQGKQEADGSVTTKQVKKVKKHVAADTGAIIFYLTNRKGSRWVNTRRNELVGKDGKEFAPIVWGAPKDSDGKKQ